MNHNYVARYGDITLRPLYDEDIEKLRVWRNNPNNTHFLRNIGQIQPEQQKRWFEGYLEDMSEYMFAIVDNSVVNGIVGSISLYNFNENVAEIGRILIGDERAHGRGIGRKALVMAMAVGFEKMKLTKIVSSVSPDNVQAYTNDIKVGFAIVGEHVLENGLLEKEIAITYEELKKKNEYVGSIEFLVDGV